MLPEFTMNINSSKRYFSFANDGLIHSLKKKDEWLNIEIENTGWSYISIFLSVVCGTFKSLGTFADVLDYE